MSKNYAMVIVSLRLILSSHLFHYAHGRCDQAVDSGQGVRPREVIQRRAVGRAGVGCRDGQNGPAVGVGGAVVSGEGGSYGDADGEGLGGTGGAGG